MWWLLALASAARRGLGALALGAAGLILSLLAVYLAQQAAVEWWTQRPGETGDVRSDLP